MDRVLQPLCDPISSKCDENDQADDFGGGAASVAGGASGIAATAAGFVFHVYSHQRDGKPGAESHRDDATNGADEEDVAKALGYVHGLL